jgi:hypothetical protein
VLVNPSDATVPVSITSNSIRLGNTTTGSNVDIISPIFTFNTTPGTLTSGSPNISAAQFLGRILVYAGTVAITSQIDTAANFLTALATAAPYVGMTVEALLVNNGTGAITLQQASDASITIVGSVTVAAGATVSLRVRFTNVTTGTAAGVLYT